MASTTSTSGAQRPRAFYLPATAVLSTVPGRVQRLVSTLGRERGRLVRSAIATEPVREFYLPATAVASAAPGRVERFVTEHLRDHGAAARLTAHYERVREFYLPATPRS